MRAPAPPAAVERLSAALRVHPQLAAVLWARGLRDDAADHLDPPFALTRIADLDAAAERLVDAVDRGRRVRIHGDYDADGISGTALLTLGLRALGARCTPFIPHRLQDGYGIHPDRVAEHAADTDLLVTVDCGITNLEEIAALQSSGVEVIVSDHHTPGERLPDCLIVHPSRSPGASRGLPGLTGAGLAYHLLWAVHRRVGLADPVEFADLAAIGTIADVAPLLGENRALVKVGLERMHASAWPGVRATLALARLSGAPTARDVAFGLAPRLNAAGRLGEADLGLELLTTASSSRALEIAARLEEQNRTRKRIQEAMLESALRLVDPEAPAIVLADPTWHAGVMGLVASNLVERFNRPAYIVASGKGSVRSTPGISAVEGLRAAARHLRRWGGHDQAAGFALDMDRFDAFRGAVLAYVAEQPRPTVTVLVDALLGIDDIDADLYASARELEPYGEGHPPPGFLLSATLAGARTVGHDGAHLQVRVASEDGTETKGVAFRQGAMATVLRVGEPVDVAAVLTENAWNGRTTIEFQALALRSGEALTTVGLRGAGAHDRLRVTRELADADAHRISIEPGADDPFRQLRDALQNGDRVQLHLHPARQRDLIAEARSWPSVSDVRKAWVARARGSRPPFAAPLAERADAVLVDLGLLDGDRRIVPGRKVEPYASTLLRAGLVRRYALLTLVEAYRRLDDAGFADAAESMADLRSV